MCVDTGIKRFNYQYINIISFITTIPLVRWRIFAELNVSKFRKKEIYSLLRLRPH